MALKTPIALLLFNRPDVTAQVFAAIRAAEPSTLYLIADGPRSADDLPKCEETRRIVDAVDWDCRVAKNYSETNLGCGKRASSGFTWVFSEVEEAIILEDDTLPRPSFFSFCEQLLDRYRDEPRVMHINGINLQDERASADRVRDAYYFSKYTHSWGWASWRRAWRHYDYEMKRWPDFATNNTLERLCPDPVEAAYWSEIFAQMHQDPARINTWDYQWLFACWANDGLAVTPSLNLVTNLGFGHPDSTHTFGESPLNSVRTGDIWQIGDPPNMEVHREADEYEFESAYGGAALRQHNSPLGKLRNRMRRLRDSLRARSRISGGPS